MRSSLVRFKLMSESIIRSHSNAQSGRKTEPLTVNWPEQEDWHIVDQQDDATGTMTSIIL